MINFLHIREHLHEYHEDKSWWAYFYCLNIKDRPSIRKFITHGYWANEYCRNIKEDTEVAKRIDDFIELRGL